MNIEFKRKNEVHFADIEAGECFVWNGVMYLKIRKYYDKDNAFCLSSKKIISISSTLVEPLESKLILKTRGEEKE